MIGTVFFVIDSGHWYILTAVIKEAEVCSFGTYTTIFQLIRSENVFGLDLIHLHVHVLNNAGVLYGFTPQK